MDEHAGRENTGSQPDDNSLPVGKIPAQESPQNSTTQTPPIPVGQQDVGSAPPGAAANNQQAQHPNPLPVFVTNESLNARVVEDNELSEFERRTINFARAGFGLALFTLAVAIFTGWVFYGQLNELSEQTNVAEFNAKKARLEASASDRTAAKQLELAQKSVEAIQGQTRTSERAWISADAVNVVNARENVQVTFNQVFATRVVFLNAGHTPALNARCVIRRNEVDSVKGKFSLPKFQYAPSSWNNIGTIQSGGTPFQDVPGWLDQPDFDSIEKTKRFYVHGVLTYDDVFQVHHWKNYCYYLTPGGAYAFCRGHNDIDKNVE
jgi:hypothetical protein